MAEYIVDIASSYYFIGSVAFSIGSILILHNLFRNGLSFPLGVVALTLAIYGGLIGSRVLFILHSAPRLFIEDPLLALAFWQGGLSWLGGPIVGSAAFLAVMAASRESGWSHLGCGASGLALSHALARSACLVRGCCYGRPTDLPWGIYSSEVHTVVHPTQAYSMTIEILMAISLQMVWWKRPKDRKYLMPLYVLALGAQRFAIEYFRGDPPGTEILSGLRFYQVVSLIMITGSVAILLLLRGRERPIVSVVTAVSIGAFVLVLALRIPDRFVRANDAGGSNLETVSSNSKLSPNTPVDNEAVKAGRYLVATRTMFSDTLLPWIQHREAQGFEVVVRAWDRAAGERDVLQWVAQESTNDTRFLLLVGDAPAEDETAQPWHLPALRRVLQSQTSSNTFPYDAGFSDLDHDGVPNFAVGRIPAKTQDELRLQVDKIVQYETSTPGQAWERAVVWTGANGFDYEMERLTDEMIAHVPSWLRMHRIRSFGGENEDPHPAQEFLAEIREPAMISFVASHGSLDTIWTSYPDSEVSAISTTDVQNALTGTAPLGPLFLLACDAGRYDSHNLDGESLAEVFLFQSGGPITVVASSGTTHAMTNYLYTRAMLDELHQLPESVGEFMHGVQVRTGNAQHASFTDLAKGDDLAEYFIESFNGTMAIHLPGRFQHESESYNLLGDPATPFRTAHSFNASMPGN